MTLDSEKIPSSKALFEPIAKIPIDARTKEWSSDLDTALPINGLEIPSFKAWINWNGFHLDEDKGKGHDGFDFAAYLTTDGRIVLGLPVSTKIRAVADGEVRQVLDFWGEYGTQINIEHGEIGSGMFSAYAHVKPSVKAGTHVKKGDVIGTLHKDPGKKEGRLVHLHLSLTNGWGTKGTPEWGGGWEARRMRADDPGLIDNKIYNFHANPQGSADFTVPDLPDIEIVLSHFEKIRL